MGDRVWTALVLGCILTAMPAVVEGQEPAERSTRSGVYTPEQARQGQEIYQGRCRACHTQAAHAGTFQGAWSGRPLAEPFQYVLDEMPKDGPGSLSREETASIMAYFLELIGMPAGSDTLPGDPGRLTRIRIDTLLTSTPIPAAEEKKP